MRLLVVVSVLLAGMMTFAAPFSWSQTPACPLSGTVDMNFDSVPVAPGDFVDGVAYLNSYGITFTPLTPGAQTLIYNVTGTAGMASSPPNVLYVTPLTGPAPVSYTLSLCAPVMSISFTRGGVDSCCIVQAWTVRVFNSMGSEVATVGEPTQYGNGSSRRFTLAGQDIRTFRFDASNVNYAFNHPPFDDFTLKGCDVARQTLMEEYVQYRNVALAKATYPDAVYLFDPAPSCDMFTQTYSNFNPTSGSSWWLVRAPLSDGWSAWDFFYISQGGPPLTINSGYRNPAYNAGVPSVPGSRHVFGDALDVCNGILINGDCSPPERFADRAANWEKIYDAAIAAGADWLETANSPYPCHCTRTTCKCVHADWRKDAGAYIPDGESMNITSRAAAVAIITMAAPMAAQNSSYLSDLQSEDVYVRMRAFAEVTRGGIPSDESTRRALMNLLEHESAYLRRLQATTDDYENEEYATYYSGVVGVVAAFRDPRSLNALIDLMNTGDIVTDALASFGSIAVDPVIARIDSPTAGVTLSAVRVLHKMLSSENTLKLKSDPVSLNKIRVALERASLSSNPLVRSTAREALSALK